MGIFDNPFTNGDVDVDEKGEYEYVSNDEPETHGNTDSEPEMVEVEVTKEAEYTEHTGVAKFIDGTETEYTFDDMKERDNAIVLKDYDRYVPGATTWSSGFYGKAFVTIPHAYLKSFETVERTTKAMEYEVTEEVPEGEVEEYR